MLLALTGSSVIIYNYKIGRYDFTSQSNLSHFDVTENLGLY